MVIEIGGKPGEINVMKTKSGKPIQRRNIINMTNDAKMSRRMKTEGKILIDLSLKR